MCINFSYDVFEFIHLLCITNYEMLILKGSPGNLVQFEELLFSNVDLVAGTAVIAVRLSGDSKARVSISTTSSVLCC